ncbi:hypothetical protein B484DRAFT_391957 [Ochromonadaceae sp. CCMP2298]|nr:hypothetical protein B484DRAFT_391957 [Ochromonadaceae sp. CCMP2298]
MESTQLEIMVAKLVSAVNEVRDAVLGVGEEVREGLVAIESLRAQSKGESQWRAEVEAQKRARARVQAQAEAQAEVDRARKYLAELLQRVGFKNAMDAPYLTAEDVGALVAMMKPVARKRLEKAWADMRAAVRVGIPAQE